MKKFYSAIRTRRHFNILKLIGTITLVMSFSFASAQCEGLKGDHEVLNKWKSSYINYFGVGPAFDFIQADSVLIYFISNPENQTNYGMPCCYFLADQYAQKELAENLKALYPRLEKDDLIRFRKAQQAWQYYYDKEWEFLRRAFIAYANFSKYGQGREIMIETQSRKYQMIKDRIQTVKSYIELVTQ